MFKSIGDLCRLLHSVVTDPNEPLDYKLGFGGIIVVSLISIAVVTIAVFVLLALAAAYLIPLGGL